MTAHDFDKQPRDSRRFDIWISRRRIETPMGEFAAELREAPDAELVTQANSLAQFLRNNIDAVWDKVYEHYQRAAAHQEWMKTCGVPIGLGQKDILPYLRSRQIVIERDADKVVDGVIFIDPRWDVEHKIYLRLVGDELCYSDW